MNIFESKKYQTILNRVANGWNTWDTHSMLNHVHLPSGFSICLGFCLFGRIQVFKNAHTGRFPVSAVQGTTFQANPDAEENHIEVNPGLHSYDGRYTALHLNIRGLRFKVESAKEGEDLVLRITPIDTEIKAPVLIVEGKMLWNHPGHLFLETGGNLRARCPDSEFLVFATAQAVDEPNLPAVYPYLALPVNHPLGLSTGKRRSLDEISSIIDKEREAEEQKHDRYGVHAELHRGMQIAQAWNVIYEPKFKRVICPVARSWNVRRLGYVLFCWDSFFTARIISADDKDLASLVALETFREMVDERFVPNCAQGSGRISRDRSQPPVGSTSIWAIFQAHEERWLLEAAWTPLLNWSRWWHEERQNRLGSISGGSHPIEPKIGDPAEYLQPNTRLGAALESGGDNGHLYDDIPFDTERHQLLMGDVCMTSFYLRDCQDLLKIARELGKTDEAHELEERIRSYGNALEIMWNESEGIYQNVFLESETHQNKMAATNFYPLLTGLPSQDRAERMAGEHLLNPEEFWGQWVVPVSPKNDPSFADQLYWRGRIWPPVNFLIYLGLKEYDLPEARNGLVEISKEMFLNEWKENASVWENYSPISGKGGDSPNSHPLYTWGGLLGLMALIEDGVCP